MENPYFQQQIEILSIRFITTHKTKVFHLEKRLADVLKLLNLKKTSNDDKRT